VASAEVFRILEIDASTLNSERSRILAALRNAIPFASVMEVGSTALEGVVGKQDLDFSVRVPEATFEDARTILDALFQRNDHQLSNSEYQGYLVASPLDAAFQLFVAGGPYDTFETFLRLLANNSSLRHAYNDLKREWHGRPMDGYRLAKQAFIESALNESDESERAAETRDES
jgi:GrpB-like predicted nucleotidyltransferase (UPF0157 family)